MMILSAILALLGGWAIAGQLVDCDPMVYFSQKGRVVSAIIRRRLFRTRDDLLSRTES